MIKRIRVVIALALACCLISLSGVSALAAENYISYAGYTFSLRNKLASIHSYDGDEGELYIPETIWNYTVTGIDEYAFFERSDLKNLYLEYSAQLKTIGKYAFYGCSAFTYAEIPPKVETLGEGAFQSCSGLEKVIFDGKSIGAIEAQTFYGCSSLREIELPDSVVSVGDLAFADCDSLEKIVIPPSVTVISDNAFKNSDKVTILCRYDTQAHRYAKLRDMDYVLFDPPYDLGDAQVTVEYASAAFDGGAHEPAVTLTIGGEALVSGRDYRVEYKDNVLPGEAEISIRGLREYGGELSRKFRISNVRGDVNANGEVDILDATRIQRYLAGFDVDDPERIELCGAITSGAVSIIDATVIQRFLVGLENEYGIGEYM